MKHDRITIFNHIASNNLLEVDLFEQLLEYHFEKFRYFYSLLENINLQNIKCINCKEKKKSLKLYIVPLENKYINDIIDRINNQRNIYALHDSFNLDVNVCDGQIEIQISLNPEAEEVELYED